MTAKKPQSASRHPKKKREPQAIKDSPNLLGPLSQSLKVRHSIDTYVHRSTAERHDEESRVGRVKRPMNAFMLYRKAYQNKVKKWCSGQHNVSRVCGNSWASEPENIRGKFKKWADIERNNHRRAHPHYKFTPSKPHKGKAFPSRKRHREDGRNRNRNAPDWHKSKRLRCTDSPQIEVEHQDGSVHVNRSAFHANNPGKPTPQPYDAHATYQIMQEINGKVENIMYKKMPSPDMLHHQHDGNGPPPPQMQHHPQDHDAQHLRVDQQHTGERVNLSRLPLGVGGQLPDLSGYGQYPHQLDPAHSGSWHESLPEQVYLNQVGQYAVASGDLGDPTVLFVSPAQNRFFNEGPWQILES